jgi:hypothetical protein
VFFRWGSSVFEVGIWCFCTQPKSNAGNTLELFWMLVLLEKICTQKKIPMSLDKDKLINKKNQLNILKLNYIFILNGKQ